MANKLDLKHPQLVYKINSISGIMKQTNTVIKKAGTDMLKHLDALDHKIEHLCQEQSTQFSAVDRHFALLEEGASHLLMSVKDLSVEMANTQQALLTQHSRSRLTDQTHIFIRKNWFCPRSTSS